MICRSTVRKSSNVEELYMQRRRLGDVWAIIFHDAHARKTERKLIWQVYFLDYNPASKTRPWLAFVKNNANKKQSFGTVIRYGRFQQWTISIDRIAEFSARSTWHGYCFIVFLGFTNIRLLWSSLIETTRWTMQQLRRLKPAGKFIIFLTRSHAPH